MRDEGVFGLLSGTFGFDTFGLQVCLQLLGIPALVRTDGVVLPVLLDQILQILAICWSRVGDVVVGEPSLELSLVPLVIG